MNSPPIRVGGMAFGNGVLMRGPRHWAWARSDGSVLEGRVRSFRNRERWLRVPLVRPAVILAETFGLMVFLHRRNGARRGALLALWMGLSVVVDLALGVFVPVIVRNAVLASLLVEVVAVAFTMFALREGLGRTVWRYHGAEHKAVNAYEAGADLRDVNGVMPYSRVHARCGTNLVVIMWVLFLFGYALFPTATGGGVTGLVYTLLVIAVSFEVFNVATRWPRSRPGRAVLAGGKALQRCVTTREPGTAEVALACTALRRVLALERAA